MEKISVDIVKCDSPDFKKRVANLVNWWNERVQPNDSPEYALSILEYENKRCMCMRFIVNEIANIVEVELLPIIPLDDIGKGKGMPNRIIF